MNEQNKHTNVEKGASEVGNRVDMTAEQVMSPLLPRWWRSDETQKMTRGVKIHAVTHQSSEHVVCPPRCPGALCSFSGGHRHQRGLQ